MFSAMLKETKKSPVMSREAASYEDRHWYLLLTHAGGHSRKQRISPASYSAAFSGGEIMLWVIIMSRLSFKALSQAWLPDVLQRGIEESRNRARGGCYEHYRVQKGKLMQKVQWHAPGHPDRGQRGCCVRVKFTRSSSCHINPLNIL